MSHQWRNATTSRPKFQRDARDLMGQGAWGEDETEAEGRGCRPGRLLSLVPVSSIQSTKRRLTFLQAPKKAAHLLSPQLPPSVSSARPNLASVSIVHCSARDRGPALSLLLLLPEELCLLTSVTPPTSDRHFLTVATGSSFHLP